ncbi:bifunctional phosphoribosylaminoimidazolecarboxamide formyltransferase/IMP cyclohydrolase [Blochmannia endosymbiont of Colobopsis nipponica]|uniref:bifunctional phosphoribosylaminoimidazolecarboxamide formyltransferase/IMP cyclohydrolase n=1 Tax=Blochmannia endosymbiont of Colobopsis nipponica TaxID=2681987 RepID=UPI001783D6EB|nr:bifunctional phosphoribosylaminoimidazolecarboxamide formyltransferase/IMP cyclohydrolase [Blochmannia endosymbiont of Colobopsis nipponica]QOI10922.1 bifunctional phosphoribosylaminoimidazolecarboxamide formyltransferase/IMP cyclohydrolase [Blochmannia endosymbiont of Colobopsis nipponica]
MQCLYPIYRVLISVYDKTGILNFSKFLHEKNIQIISTAGTAAFLKKEGLTTTEISDYINFPELMDGRIKTLHPKIYGGILARPDLDKKIMNEFNIDHIDMVIVNLYPFNSKIKRKQKNILKEKQITNIDIGGPSIVRAAAKNYKKVAVLVHSCDYAPIIHEMNNNNNSLTIQTKFKLAAKAFEHVATYDRNIANYFQNVKTKNNGNKNKQSILNFPKNINIINEKFVKEQDLNYGENHHQKAAFYVNERFANKSLNSTIKKIQGKSLSYNNIVDIDTALECIKMFTKPTCIIIKHNTPCGVASSENIQLAYQKAYQADPISAFGGIIALNQTIDAQTANLLQQQFAEVIIAPSIKKNALNILSNKKNMRIVTYKNKLIEITNIDIKIINNGGLLVQEHDKKKINFKRMNIVTKRSPTKKEINDAIFCWKIIKFVKSNAIVYAKNNQTIGIGSGQMSRVFSAKIAAIKTKNEGLETHGATMASDAFLPFCDCIEVAGELGISCVIQPGGSIKDEDIIKTANRYNIAMIFTYTRHFKH